MKQTNRTLSILLAILMLFSVATTAFAAGGNGGGSTALTVQSATINDTPVAEATEIHGNDTILLTFSGNVTDSSVWVSNSGKIQLKDGSGNAASISLTTPGGKKVGVVLGNLAKATYTLTIGKEFKDANGNTLGAKYELTFTVNKGNGTGTGGGNGESPLSFVSAKANGADLAGAELESSGAITITFDRGMTENQAANFEQIGIYNAHGTKMEGASFTNFKKDTDGNSFTVLSYENLPAGTYTLKLGKDLTANNGNTLGKAVNITFSVKGADNDKTDFLHSIIDAIVNFFKSIAEFFKNIFKK